MRLVLLGQSGGSVQIPTKSSPSGPMSWLDTNSWESPGKEALNKFTGRRQSAKVASPRSSDRNSFFCVSASLA